MHGTFSEHNQEPAGLHPASHGHERQPGNPPPLGSGVAPRADPGAQVMPAPGFLGFLDNVLGSDEKTRRLGFLIGRTATAIAVILAPLTALCYILTFNSSIQMKLAVGGGSALLITVGGVARSNFKSRQARKAKLPIASQADGEASRGEGIARGRPE